MADNKFLEELYDAEEEFTPLVGKKKKKTPPSPPPEPEKKPEKS